ncbi:MAG: hypothetical protein R3F29_08980 [Planctomycetota bacterium]
MDRDEPVSTSEAAELRVLEVALAERASRGACDAWPAIEARLAAAGAAVAPRRRGRVLMAAMALLGLGVVIATALWREAPSPRQATPVQGRADDPRTLEQLQLRMRVAGSANVQTLGVWSEALGRWVDLERWPLDSLFKSGTSPSLPVSVQALLVAAIEGATVVDRAVVRDVVWTHRLNLPSAESVDQNPGVVLLLRVGGDQPARLAFRSPDGPIELACPALPLPQLLHLLDKSSWTTVSELGFAIGPAGLADVPLWASRLRLIDVPESAFGELQRFSKLPALDLRRAPAWHSARVLEALAARQPPSLIVSPRMLDHAGFAAIGRSGVEHLMLCDEDAFAVLLSGVEVATVPGFDDRALASLAGLTELRELTLGGGAFTDVGLATLAPLPLKELSLIGCHGVGGSGLVGFSSLETMTLWGGGPDAGLAVHLARLPRLRRLWLFDVDGLSVAPLANAPALEVLGIRTAWSPDLVRQLAAVQRIGDLVLDLTPRPGADDLRPLVALQGLKRLTLIGADADTVAALREVLPQVKSIKSDD